MEKTIEKAVETKLYEVEFDIEKREGETSYSFLKVHVRTIDEEEAEKDAYLYAEKVLGIEESRLNCFNVEEI
ncbi:hypothetical protein [Paenibacillus alba]|uniref:Uncharacterized protein n=1 Tax=Paenibacillus alba TaxID=1197127 RepID=A0ABU6FY26_9BACL|nr:hypothetical protein [Paenibacillus alba]MEC0226820.1 hypothetical protein [Paenibacillus alba]